MRIYKIRHKPTGLFLQNKKHVYGKLVDTLTKDGGAYNTRPLLSWLSGGSRSKRIGVVLNDQFHAFPEEEFEIVEYDLETNNG